MTACIGGALWSLTRKTGNEKWVMAGWGQGIECIHHPFDKPSSKTSDPVLPFWTHSCSFLSARGRVSTLPNTERDVIGRDRKHKTLRASRQVLQTQRGREREPRQNHSSARHARCAKTPDLLSRKSARLRQRNKPGLTGVRKSLCSRTTWDIPSPWFTLSASTSLFILPPLQVCVFLLFSWSFISHCWSAVSLEWRRLHTEIRNNIPSQ